MILPSLSPVWQEISGTYISRLPNKWKWIRSASGEFTFKSRKSPWSLKSQFLWILQKKHVHYFKDNSAEKSTFILSGDWTTLDSNLEFSWTIFTSSKSAWEIWTPSIETRSQRRMFSSEFVTFNTFDWSNKMECRSNKILNSEGNKMECRSSTLKGTTLILGSSALRRICGFTFDWSNKMECRPNKILNFDGNSFDLMILGSERNNLRVSIEFFRESFRYLMGIVFDRDRTRI